MRMIGEEGREGFVYDFEVTGYDGWVIVLVQAARRESWLCNGWRLGRLGGVWRV